MLSAISGISNTQSVQRPPAVQQKPPPERTSATVDTVQLSSAAKTAMHDADAPAQTAKATKDGDPRRQYESPRVQ